MRWSTWWWPVGRRVGAGHGPRHGDPFQAVRRPPDGPKRSGVKGIKLIGDDSVVGMVVADPDATLLTVCANGYGKRTPFGPNMETGPEEELPEHGDDATDDKRTRM